MSPGSVLNDTNFQFKDGETGNKLFVVLCNSNTGYCVVAKTTSQQNTRSSDPGCNIDDRFANFFIPNQVTFFPKDTWICLDEFYNMQIQAMLNKKTNREIKVVDKLDSQLLSTIIDCATDSQDLTLNQETLLKRELDELEN